MNWSGGSKHRFRLLRNDVFPLRNDIKVNHPEKHLRRIPIVDCHSDTEPNSPKIQKIIPKTSPIVQIKSCMKSNENLMELDRIGRDLLPSTSKQPFANIQSGANDSDSSGGSSIESDEDDDEFPDNDETVETSHNFQKFQEKEVKVLSPQSGKFVSLDVFHATQLASHDTNVKTLDSNSNELNYQEVDISYSPIENPDEAPFEPFESQPYRSPSTDLIKEVTSESQTHHSPSTLSINEAPFRSQSLTVKTDEDQHPSEKDDAETKPEKRVKSRKKSKFSGRKTTRNYHPITGCHCRTVVRTIKIRDAETQTSPIQQAIYINI